MEFDSLGKILWIEHSEHSSGLNSYWAIPANIHTTPHHGRFPDFTLPLPPEFPKWAIPPCPWNSIVINPPPPTVVGVNQDEGRFLSHTGWGGKPVLLQWYSRARGTWNLRIGAGGIWKSVNIPKYLQLCSLFLITIQKRETRQLIFFGTTNKPIQMTSFKSLQ